MADLDIGECLGWFASTFIKTSYSFSQKFTLLTSMDSLAKYSLLTGSPPFTTSCGHLLPVSLLTLLKEMSLKNGSTDILCCMKQDKRESISLTKSFGNG